MKTSNLAIFNNSVRTSQKT